IGVNILIQGSQQGTTTDASGNFTLQVPGGDAVLVVSYIGYTTQTIPVGGQSTINIMLQPEVSELQEIVVIGYGTMRRNEVTSAVSNVKSEDFNKGNVNNPVQLIQGKVAGLSISKPGGNPNAGFDVRLRGLNTVGTNTGPLVVIDGVAGGNLSNVDPNDVENISVLKDASAAAIYGTRGSNGVILVTTKRGRSGATQLEYNGYVTAEMVAKNTPVMSASEWRELSAAVGAGTDHGASTDWFDEIEQTAFSHVHNLSLSGGTETTNYRASINYRDANGIMITTGNNQFNGRLNLTQKAIKDRLTIDINIGGTERNSDNGFDAAFRYASIYNPTAPVYSDDPALARYGGYYQQEIFDYYNPVSILKSNFNIGKERLINLSGKVSLEILKGFRADAFYSVQTSGNLIGEYRDKNDYWGGINRNGLAQREERSENNKLFETTLHYNGNVVSDLNLNLLGGYSYQDFNSEGFFAQGGDLLIDNFRFNNLFASTDFKNGLGTVWSRRSSNRLIAFFGRMNLNFKETVFLMASARYEGSSKFGANEKWGLFPAVSAGVEISRFLNIAAIDNLKLRVNYGVTGNLPTESYLSLERWGISPNVSTAPQYFLINGDYVPAYFVIGNPNPNLKWEKQGEFDAGFDFSLLGSRLFGSFDFYTRNTTDLLFNFDVPNPPNLYRTAWVNIGEIKSSGLELTLNFRALQNSNFTYTVSFSPSYNLENTLVSLSGEFNNATLEYGIKDLGDMGSPGQNQTPLVRVEEGGPIGNLLALEFQEIDEDGNLVLVDQPGTSPGVDQDDRVIVGNGLPKFLFGFGNDFTYKNWDLNIFLRGVFGHDLLNSFRGFYEVPEMIESYNLPETAKDLKNGTTGTFLNNSSGVLSSYHIEDGDFVALDDASLGYNFSVPSSWPLTELRLYVAGNNLFYITKYKGVDPTPRYVDSDTGLGTYNNPLVPGVDRRDTWFRTRSVTFGANIIF
ncbi:MAG TPA: SusC/RagA family TonB-linked outer membrane protein, partial [Bacteroidales bacterium]|nr:SusC/RagA family TonB-linked outer membrane protein [Bacteroidales bacterium]